jgi:AcrR family transcriptional regulator
VAVQPTESRAQASEAFLDAAERLLMETSWADVTVRRLAAEAGLNHGLVHYYFGSMEEVFVQVLERFTARLVERQREMYEGEATFLEKWRTAIGYLDADRESGYQKIWFELQSMAWNHPELRERIASVNAEWRAVLTDAIATAMKSYGLDTGAFPVGAVVSLVMTFNEGIMLERLSGVTAGHDELLTAIDRWLHAQEHATTGRKQ